MKCKEIEKVLFIMEKVRHLFLVDNIMWALSKILNIYIG